MDTQRRIVPTREIGITGLEQANGYVLEEKLRELAGSARWRRVLREMIDNDPIINAILNAIELMLRPTTWTVEPAGEGDDDKEAADFVRECMDDMSHSWQSFIAETVTFVAWGWSASEIVYKRRLGRSDNPRHRSRYTDGKIGWRKLSPRAQETLYRWHFQPDGGISGLWQLAPPQYNAIYIPIERLLLFRTTSRKNNPEGRSLLRGVYRPWYMRKHLEVIESIGIERDLAGLPVMYAPPEFTDPNATGAAAAIRDSLRDIVTNIRADEQAGVLLPDIRDERGNRLLELKLLTTGGTRAFDTSASIDRYAKQIVTAVLADFILLGQDRVGSYALGDTKTQMFYHALNVFADEIRDVLNMHAIPRLWEINNFPMDTMPQLQHGRLAAVDIVGLATYLTSLTGAGMDVFPDPALEQHLYRIAHLPTPTIEKLEERAAEAQERKEEMREMMQQQPEPDESEPGRPGAAAPPTGGKPAPAARQPQAQQPPRSPRSQSRRRGKNG